MCLAILGHKTKIMKKTVLTFGLLSGIIIIVYSLIVFMAFGSFSSMSTSDFARVEMLGYLRYIILLLTVIFAIRYFKKQNGGVLLLNNYGWREYIQA